MVSGCLLQSGAIPNGRIATLAISLTAASFVAYRDDQTEIDGSSGTLARKLQWASVMRTTITTFAIAALAAMFTSVTFAGQTAHRTPTTVKEVMTTMTIPASDAIFAAASEPPTNAEGWTALRNSAATLAESARMLTTTTLAKDKTTWMEMARDLVSEAEATVRVADARNREALEQASDALYTTCKSCHDRYTDGAQ